jgi:hypothetical protein
MTFPYSSGDVLTAADLNANIDETAQFVARSTGSGSGYPASVTSGGAWVVPVAISVTATAGDKYYLQIETTWTNTAANIINFYIYDTGTGSTAQFIQGRFAANENNITASCVWTAPTSGGRNLALYFTSSTGTMYAWGSDNVTNLTGWKIQ